MRWRAGVAAATVVVEEEVVVVARSGAGSGAAFGGGPGMAAEGGAEVVVDGGDGAGFACSLPAESSSRAGAVSSPAAVLHAEARQAVTIRAGHTQWRRMAGL